MMQSVGSRPALVVLLLLACAGCGKLRAWSDRSESSDTSVGSHERVFGDTKLTLPDDMTVRDFSGGWLLTRPPATSNSLDIASLSAWEFDHRERTEPIKLALPGGRLGYRLETQDLGSGPEVTLIGEMKVDPDSYSYVTCHVYSLTRAPPSAAWCLSILRTAAHR